MSVKKLRLCFVGNMLGRNAGHLTSQGQILADLFATAGYSVSSVSARVNKIIRLIDIVQFIARNACHMDVLILEVYSGQYMILADVVSRLANNYKIPLIAVLHGGNLLQFTVRRQRWVTNVFKRAKVLTAPSLYLADSMKTFGFEVQVIPNVIELQNYPFRLRSEVAPRLIWMRSFHSAYNPHLAIKAFAALRETHPRATLVMAGRDKGLEAEIKQFAQNMQVADAVRFPGFLDQAAKLREFAQADIYLNTNNIDNMPVAVIEAGAFGLPIVATNVGGISNLLEDNKTGLLVPSDDPGAMLLAIKKLLNQPQLTEQLSSNGRQLAERSSWKAVRRDWESLFLAATN